MNFLLFGRGVAGVGAAGLFVAIFSAVAQVSNSLLVPRIVSNNLF